jgi:alpha-mannosidase
VRRPQDGIESPQQNWAALSDSTRTVAILNRGIYGARASANTLWLTLLNGGDDFDARMDEGNHCFEYAICSFTGAWTNAGIAGHAADFNQPLVGIQENPHGGVCGASRSFYAVDKDHVILSALKPQQEPWPIAGPWEPLQVIMRLFETAGRSDSVTVHLPVNARRVIEVNHVEDPLDSAAGRLVDNRFSFRIRPHQIRSFRIDYPWPNK